MGCCENFCTCAGVLLLAAWAIAGVTFVTLGSIDQNRHAVTQGVLRNISECALPCANVTLHDDSNDDYYGPYKRATRERRLVCEGAQFTADVVYIFDTVAYTAANYSVRWFDNSTSCDAVYGNPAATVIVDRFEPGTVLFVNMPDTRYFSGDLFGGLLLLGVLLFATLCTVCCEKNAALRRRAGFTSV
jgi:hypothetical protein